MQVGEHLPLLSSDCGAGQDLPIHAPSRCDDGTTGEVERKVRRTYAVFLPVSLFQEMHAAKVPIANICEAMGHTIEILLKSYSSFKPKSMAALTATVSD